MLNLLDCQQKHDTTNEVNVSPNDIVVALDTQKGDAEITMSGS